MRSRAGAGCSSSCSPATSSWPPSRSSSTSVWHRREEASGCRRTGTFSSACSPSSPRPSSATGPVAQHALSLTSRTEWPPNFEGSSTRSHTTCSRSPTSSTLPGPSSFSLFTSFSPSTFSWCSATSGRESSSSGRVCGSGWWPLSTSPSSTWSLFSSSSTSTTAAEASGASTSLSFFPCMPSRLRPCSSLTSSPIAMPPLPLLQLFTGCSPSSSLCGSWRRPASCRPRSAGPRRPRGMA
mmetsp:Transcript_11724/g.40506  ORF Transcript_11724/g.40506 Transcript_11724/m.40506 type:complete len:239 (-) Transcript_11724:267-983(-)